MLWKLWCSLQYAIFSKGGPYSECTALWFNRGMGPKSRGIIFANFSLVCIGVVCQGGSVTIKLCPGLNHQCTLKKNKAKIEFKILNPSPS